MNSESRKAIEVSVGGYLYKRDSVAIMVADQAQNGSYQYGIHSVYPGSWIRLFSIPDPGSASKRIKVF
jgi:hypothetical protein